MAKLRTQSTALTLLLGALVTLASFATDMGLPVLAATAASLGVAPATAALTLSMFMAGFALGPLFFGPLSDQYGRRPVLLSGCAVYAACGGLAAFSGSLDGLLVWRFLMGAGAGTCQVLVLTVVRDLFEGQEARAKQSYVNLAGGVAPIIAPTLGVGIAVLGGWRAIYGALAVGGLCLLLLAARYLEESSPRRSGTAFSLRAALGSYGRVLAHPVSLGNALVMALSFGWVFAYVSGSPLLLIGMFGISQRAYGYLFACTALGLVAGAFASARLSRLGVPHERVVSTGLTAVVATAFLLVALTSAGWLSVGVLVPIAIVGMVGQGLIRPHAAQGALEPMPEIAGVASAVLSSLQMLTGALASAAVAALFGRHSALAITGTMAACGVAAAGVYLSVVRPAERRLARARASGAASTEPRAAAA